MSYPDVECTYDFTRPRIHLMVKNYAALSALLLVVLVGVFALGAYVNAQADPAIAGCSKHDGVAKVSGKAPSKRTRSMGGFTEEFPVKPGDPVSYSLMDDERMFLMCNDGALVEIG